MSILFISLHSSYENCQEYSFYSCTKTYFASKTKLKVPEIDWLKQWINFLFIFYFFQSLFTPGVQWAVCKVYYSTGEEGSAADWGNWHRSQTAHKGKSLKSNLNKLLFLLKL